MIRSPTASFSAKDQGMEEKPAKMWQLVSRYRNRLAIVTAAILVLLTWIITYFLSASSIDLNMKAAWIAVVAALVNLASTTAVFVVASVLFERENDAKLGDAIRQIILETQDRPVDLSQVRFPDLIDGAKEIDFVVQGWNGWAAQQPIAKSLIRFFERGGVFRLYVCNPDTNKALPN